MLNKVLTEMRSPIAEEPYAGFMDLPLEVLLIICDILSKTDYHTFKKLLACSRVLQDTLKESFCIISNKAILDAEDKVIEDNGIIITSKILSTDFPKETGKASLRKLQNFTGTILLDVWEKQGAPGYNRFFDNSRSELLALVRNLPTMLSNFHQRLSNRIQYIPKFINNFQLSRVRINLLINSVVFNICTFERISYWQENNTKPAVYYRETFPTDVTLSDEFYFRPGLDTSFAIVFGLIKSMQKRDLELPVDFFNSTEEIETCNISLNIYPDEEIISDIHERVVIEEKWNYNHHPLEKLTGRIPPYLSLVFSLRADGTSMEDIFDWVDERSDDPEETIEDFLDLVGNFTSEMALKFSTKGKKALIPATELFYYECFESRVEKNQQIFNTSGINLKIIFYFMIILMSCPYIYRILP